MSILTDANVLCTGGCGFAGSALVQQALDDGAKRVAILSRDEAKHAAHRARVNDPRVRYFLGDVRDKDRVKWAVRGCDIVLHFAASKRIDDCEANPVEAISVNVTGSEIVAMASIQAGVSLALLASTDKAAAPSTLYGGTKMVAERMWVQSNAYSAGLKTQLLCTRYGNVLGSTGSLLKLWRDELQRDGNLSLTDPACTRFIMPMREAVRVVLHALANAIPGATFIPSMRATSVDAMARAVAPDAMRRIIGLRAGEKLHETLISRDESARTFWNYDHYVIAPALNTWNTTTEYGQHRVDADFELRSDTAPMRYTLDELRALLEI